MEYMTQKKTFEVDAEEYRLLQKKNTEAQALKQIDEYIDSLSLTDAQCAKLLEQAGNIKLVGSALYKYEPVTKLWVLHTEVPTINTAILTALKPMVTKTILNLNKAAINLDLDANRKKQIKKVLSNTKTIESSRKLISIYKTCGNLMVKPTLFNSKIYTESLLPISDNKCIDLTNSKVRQRRKDDYFTFALDLSLIDETQDAERFLRSYCPTDDDDTYHYLLDILSYCITPWNFLKKFFVFHGESGDNGKSKLMKVMEVILDSLYTSVQEALFVDCKKAGSGPTPALTQCLDKFCGSYGESTSALLDETTIKMMTGDDTITIRKMYKEAEKVTLYMKLVLVGNCKPHWRHNRAMTNRFGYFAFRNMFVRKPTLPHHRKKDDKLIKLMLTTGKHQLFTLLVTNAAKLWKHKRLHKSKFISSEFKKYISEIDTTTQFIETCVREHSVGPPRTIGDIFNTYCDWCDNNNNKKERKGEFTKKFKATIPPRPARLQGNIVYDVSIATADPKPLFNQDIAYTYKKEAEAMLQELGDKDCIIEAITQERDETEAALNVTLDALHNTENKMAAQEETIARLKSLLNTKHALQPTVKRKPQNTKRTLQRK